ncbi:MAG: CapA family protein [Candidatus Riflebacteria bacterium]|nr:CapA family protein [Candidatus Riflebacteria bacterium]
MTNRVISNKQLQQIVFFSIIATVFWLLPGYAQVASISASETITTETTATATTPTSLPDVPMSTVMASSTPEMQNKQIRITAVGDIMMHQRQLDTHYDKTLESYVFDDDYIHILGELKRADLLIGNLETTLGGPDQKYSGYPLFNTPDSLAEALKRTGFDVLSTANNHCLDTGVKGLKRTAKTLRDMDFGVIGTRQSPDEKSSLLTEVKGIKIGMLGYTYETGRREKSRTINGNSVPAAALPLIDSFSPAHIDDAVKEMQGRIASLRNEGAELIVMYLHWGVEYGLDPTAGQQKMAQQLASAGVDIIFGSHPHVVQTATFIPRADGGRTFVAWSLGNFISNQRFEFLERHNTEDGLITSVTVERNSTGKIVIAKVDYQPTWVHRHARDGQWYYHILPLPQALLNPAPYNFDRANHVRARNSLIRTQKVIEGAPEWKPTPIPELP